MKYQNHTIRDLPALNDLDPGITRMSALNDLDRENRHRSTLQNLYNEVQRKVCMM